nr:hypothetical protein [Bradyrhizobium sp. SZCCHNRI3043]
MPVQNAEIAKMFDQAAELLEIKGRSRAYRNAARLIECLPKSITGLLKAGEDLSELPGIGKDLAGKIEAIVTSHKFDVLDRLRRELPGDLGEIAALPGARAQAGQTALRQAGRPLTRGCATRDQIGATARAERGRGQERAEALAQRSAASASPQRESSNPAVAGRVMVQTVYLQLRKYALHSGDRRFVP